MGAFYFESDPVAGRILESGWTGQPGEVRAQRRPQDTRSARVADAIIGRDSNLSRR